ncbi:regulator of chromosome condensation, partial [Asbolus verrucosus]
TLDTVKLPETSREGVVLVTGAGDCGQLGLGPDVYEKNRPALLQLSHEIVDICAGGMHTILTFGCNDEGALGRITEGIEDSECTPGEVELPGKVIQMSAGDSHSAALLDDGRVFAWGTFRDSHGNMGLTLKGNEKLPYEIIQDVHVIKIASGAEHIVFLTNHGEIYTCGCAEQGQLGRTSARGCTRNARTKLLQPSLINLKPSLKLHFDNIWAGTYGTFAKVAGKNDVYVCGLNNYNQIGLKSLDPQYLPKLSKEFSKYKWNMICSAQHHTIALDENGELYGWGMGTNGQLGTGGEDDCFEPTLIKSKQLVDRPVFKVSGGGQHTVILATNTNNNKGDTE